MRWGSSWGGTQVSHYKNLISNTTPCETIFEIRVKYFTPHGIAGKASSDVTQGMGQQLMACVLVPLGAPPHLAEVVAAAVAPGVTVGHGEEEPLGHVEVERHLPAVLHIAQRHAVAPVTVDVSVARSGQ
jgi:hypothetical protein